MELRQKADSGRETQNDDDGAENIAVTEGYIEPGHGYTSQRTGLIKDVCRRECAR